MASELPCVLVVEDEALLALDLEHELSAAGYKVEVATNGDDEIAVLDGPGKFAGVLTDIRLGSGTDINMPGTRNGIVLANHVRCMWPHINIVVVSGARHPMNGELPDYVTFVSKPVLPGKLMPVLQSYAE